MHFVTGDVDHGPIIAQAAVPVKNDDDAASLARARRWWGADVVSLSAGESASEDVRGPMVLCAYEECPQAEYTGIALEYGTVPLLDAINALRGDQWIENHPEADEAFRALVKKQLRDAFYVDEDGWKNRVVEQALDVAHSAIRGLNS